MSKARSKDPQGPTREEAIELVSDGIDRMTGWDRWVGHLAITRALLVLVLEVRDSADRIVAAIKASRAKP